MSSAQVAENYQLKWHSHLTNLNSCVATLFRNEKFADVLLFSSNVDNGPGIPAHKIILSSCSHYFAGIFDSNPAPPNAIMYIVLPPELSKRSIQTLVQYMYSGEATVSNDILNEVLRGGELLKIRGLWRNHPSGEPPNAIPQYQAPHPAPTQSSTTSHHAASSSNPSTTSTSGAPSTKQPIVEPHHVYQSSSASSSSSDLHRAAIDRVSCSLNAGPPPPSVVKESPVIVMSPRHASHPPSQLMHGHHQHNGERGGGSGAVMSQNNGGQHVKRELATEYPGDPLTPPPHGEMSTSMYSVRKINVSSGVLSSGEIINNRCKASSGANDYAPENGRERRFRDDHPHDRRPSIDHSYQQNPHHHQGSSHSHSSQPPAPQPRLVLRDTEVLRMTNCSSDLLHKRRPSFQPHDSPPHHHHHQHQQSIDHCHIEPGDRLASVGISMRTPSTERMASVSANNSNHHHHHRVKVSSTTMASVVSDHPIKKGRDIGSSSGPMVAEPMGFLTIKQEPLEWSEIAPDNNSAAAILLDSKAHIEVTVKPELVYPENEDSCDGADEMNEMVYSPLTCELCSETFTIPADWVRHIEGHTEAAHCVPKKRKRVDPDCSNNSSGTSAASAIAGGENIAALRCDLCSMFFVTPADWVRHVQNTHTETELALSNNSLPPKRLSRSANRSQTSSSASSSSVRHTQDGGVTITVTQHQHQHQTHAMSSHHSGTSSHEKSCPICKKLFPSYTSMNIHKRTHTV